MTTHEGLLDLVAELLERFGVMANHPLDDEYATAQEMADRLGGIEGYSLDFGATTYVLLPDDVQELLLLLASAVYSDDLELEDEYADTEEG